MESGALLGAVKVGLRVLVVEDDSLILADYAERFKLAGFSTLFLTCSAAEGLYWARTLAGEFDLIVLDIRLPEFDGFTVAREIRKAGIKTQIFLVSGLDEASMRAEAARIENTLFFAKPFRGGELFATIREHATP